MKPMADLLIVTVTKVETRAVIDVFSKATGRKPAIKPIADRVYYDFGSINDTNVFMVQSEMGAGGLGAAQQTVTKGIEALSPGAVIMLGIAFGVDSEKQSIGDILVSRNLMLYELQRVGSKDGQIKITPRGDRPHASPRLINRFNTADVDWDETRAQVRFGVILSGEKLVDNINFRDRIRKMEPEAIGGEMEGAGLYVACQDKKVDWILVKAVCDWADGNKSDNKKENQMQAARNAAEFGLFMLQQAPLKSDRSKPSETRGTGDAGKYQIHAEGAQIGVIGDNAQLSGGLHFGDTININSHGDVVFSKDQGRAKITKPQKI